jgi:hypothetical protein
MKSRRENVKRAVSVGRNGETPVKLYEHTAIWRFGPQWRCDSRLQQAIRE